MSKATTRPQLPTIGRTLLLRLSKRRASVAIGLALTNFLLYLILTIIGLKIGAGMVWLAIWIAQSLILCGVYNMMHDCVHSSFFKSSRLNKILGSLLGTIVLLNFRAYKAFHLQHHSANLRAEDPENLLQLRNFAGYIRYITQVDFFWNFARVPFRAVMGRFPEFVRSKSAQRGVLVDSIVQIIWLSMVTAWLVEQPKLAFTSYLAPLTLFPLMTGLTGLPEHYATDIDISPLANTRTMSSNWLFRLMFWFNNFHVEHHAFPWIPAYNLEQVNRITAGEFKYVERSYVGFHLRLLKEILQKRPSKDIGANLPKTP